MSASNLNLGKASGGVLNIQPTDGVTNTSIILPASGTVANTDNIVGFKNYIINGNFDYWQYKDAGLTYPQTSSGYGSDDRWSNANLGSTKTHSQVATTDTERALFNASYFSRTVVTSVAGANNFVTKYHNIENVKKLAGKTVTLSFWAKAGSNKTLGFVARQNFGTGGSPSAGVGSIGSKLFNLTSTWQKFTHTFTIPSIVGKTIGTDGVHTTATSINFGFDIGSTYSTEYGGAIQQSGTFDIAQVQLEEGSIVTPFENRPVGLELSLCQRYYEVLIGSVYNVYPLYFARRFQVKKRVTPTLTLISGGTNGADYTATDDALVCPYTVGSSVGAVGFTFGISAEF